MYIELHVIEGGVDKGPLPSVAEIDLSPVFCDYGALTFSYPINGKKYGTLLKGKDEVEVVPWVNGTARPELSALCQEIEGDDVAEAAVVKFTGIGMLKRLDEARVYPYNWPSFDPKDVSWHFTSQTAGQIMGALLLAAHNRGTITDVTGTSFSNANDSNGTAWTKTISLEIKPGATLTDVLRTLVDNGMVEFQMYGRDLRMYNPDTLSVDRTTQSPPLTFRKGRDLSDSPRKVSSRDVATVVLAAGKEDAGVYQEAVDNTAIANRRRIEGYVSNGNVTDGGTLTAFAQVNLASSVSARMEKTHGLVFAKDSNPQPLRDFHVGDWVYSDVGDGLERLRVKQWVLKMDGKGVVTGSVTLNDLFAEIEERLARRIAGIVGGSTITGASQAQNAVPDNLVDGLAPAAPTGLALSSSAYIDRNGQTFAQMTASWVQVTANTDATVCDDLQGYLVQWRYTTDGAGQWRTLEAASGTTTNWSPVTPGVNVQVQVFAYDKAGNVSPASATSTILTGSDATPPEAPAAPTVDNYLGLVRISYSAASASGAAWPADLSYFEVHASTVNNFTPSSSTLIDTVVTAGASFFKATYGQTVYAKLIAVDRSGNKSTPSAQGSGASAQVVSADVFDGAIGTAKLADLAVTTAKINDLAVNNAKIGDLSAAKITAGVMSAAVTISGRFATALTGQRMELNSIGLQGWDASNNKTIDLNGVSNLLVGSFQTALTGRRLVLGAAGTTGQLNFVAPDGTVTFLNSRTESSGIEAIQFGVGDGSGNLGLPNSLWNRININNDHGGWANYRANRHEFHMGGVNGSSGTDSANPGFFEIFQAPSTGGYGAGADFARFIIDATTLRIWEQHGRLSYQIDADGTQKLSGTSPWKAGQTYVAGGWLEIDGPSYGANSAMLKWFTPSPSYGGMAMFEHDGAGGNARINIQWWDGSGFIPLWASAFVVSSSEKVKTGIADFSGDALSLVRSAGVRTYRRKAGVGVPKPDEGEKNRKALEPQDGPEEIGLVAEEVPEAIVVRNNDGTIHGIDVSRTTALLWGAVRQIADRLDVLEKGRP